MSEILEEIKIKRLPDGNIEVELTGENTDLAIMLAETMSQHEDTAAVVAAAIPTFLDANKLSRSGYCKTVMQAQGLGGPQA